MLPTLTAEDRAVGPGRAPEGLRLTWPQRAPPGGTWTLPRPRACPCPGVCVLRAVPMCRVNVCAPVRVCTRAQYACTYMCLITCTHTVCTSMCVVCMCVCMCAHVHLCAYVDLLCAYVCSVCACVHTRISVCACVQVCAGVCVRACAVTRSASSGSVGGRCTGSPIPNAAPNSENTSRDAG